MATTRKKLTIIFVALVVIVVIFRLLLPTIVTRYANKVLADMDGYTGHIEGVNISLLRGAYVIRDLKIEKTTGKVPVPFIYAESIDLSVDWNTLFKGAIKGEVIFNKPELNFVSGKSEATSQTGTETDWTAPLKKLMPLQINRFEIQNGRISYKDFESKPKVDMYIRDLHLLATNLSNLENPNERLPSMLNIEGQSIGNGQLLITSNMNLLKQIPDADLNMKFTDISLPAINDFAKAYGKFDFEKGRLSIFSEMSLNDSKLAGYVKPILDDVRVLNWTEEKESFLQKLWQGVIGVSMDIFKNHPKDQFATKVPIEGTLDNVETKTWPTIINIIKNAFIKAYDKSIEDTVNFGSQTEEGGKKGKKFLFFNRKDKKDK
jgi:hypothetical protein